MCWKVAQTLTAAVFTWKQCCFIKAPKCHQIFGLLFWKNCYPEILIIAPTLVTLDPDQYCSLPTARCFLSFFLFFVVTESFCWSKSAKTTRTASITYLRKQIGCFITLWETFQSLWQQLFCPNWPHVKAISVKVSKSFIFLVKSFLSQFYRHLATFYWLRW